MTETIELDWAGCLLTDRGSVEDIDAVIGSEAHYRRQAGGRGVDVAQGRHCALAWSALASTRLPGALAANPVAPLHVPPLTLYNCAQAVAAAPYGRRAHSRRYLRRPRTASPPRTQEHPMLTRLTRRARKLHDDLMHTTWCSPRTGLIGHCDPVEPGVYERHALGMGPVCRCCKRETRRH